MDYISLKNLVLQHIDQQLRDFVCAVPCGINENHIFVKTDENILAHAIIYNNGNIKIIKNTHNFFDSVKHAVSVGKNV